jgi:hypothetical protein
MVSTTKNFPRSMERPLSALIPDRYFYKSVKWLDGNQILQPLMSRDIMKAADIAIALIPGRKNGLIRYLFFR